MSTGKRNFIVGMVVLGALVVLAWMIIQFGGSIATPFASPTIDVTFSTSRADGLAEGSAIYYRGVNVGKVTVVRLLPDNVNVEVDATINQDNKLPANVEGVIRQTSAFGSAATISLELTSETPQGVLESGGKPLVARWGGSGLFPPEISELANELQATARQFREANVVGNLNDQLKKVGRLTDELTDFVTDDTTRTNLRTSLANIRTASESATRIAANLEKFSGKLTEVGDKADKLVVATQSDVDELSKQMAQRLEQIARLLETSQSIMTKIDTGDGTAGKLVNDPKLYTGLVETTTSLNSIVRDLQRLVQQWEEEGVSLKLK
jgi:phospholipid/cholesterol/gamma-HCH transport system substrate-binding protein